jgi:hypothetical protein
VTRDQKIERLRQQRAKLLSELQTAPHPEVQRLIERELARVNDEIAKLVR